jgi:hypothetical protein
MLRSIIYKYRMIRIDTECDILHRHATHRCDELRSCETSDRRQPLTGQRRPVSADCRYLSIIIFYSYAPYSRAHVFTLDA